MNKRQAKKDFRKYVRTWKPHFDKAGMPIGKENRKIHYRMMEEERREGIRPRLVFR